MLLHVGFRHKMFAHDVCSNSLVRRIFLELMLNICAEALLFTIIKFQSSNFISFLSMEICIRSMYKVQFVWACTFF